MFQRFRDRYPVEVAEGCSGEELLRLIDPLPEGFPDLLIRFAGSSFGEGIYRLHTPGGARQWTGIVGEAFPDAEGRALCFGMDWRGRQFAIDVSREERGEPLVVMLDLWTGRARELPSTFVRFHNEDLVDLADDLLAPRLYALWRARGGAIPLSSQCVAYRTPLFAAGRDDVENLDLADAATAWLAVGRMLRHFGHAPSATA